MLQALLEDRFKLRIHPETREGPVYALTRAGAEPRLKPFAEGNCVQMPLTMPLPTPPDGQRYCKARIALLGPAIQAEGSTLAEFSRLLGTVLHRPVIDRTGITGRFDIDLEFALDETTQGLRAAAPPDAPAAAPDPTRPPIFAAVREHLGLKLAAARGPVEFLVIEHVERPAGN